MDVLARAFDAIALTGFCPQAVMARVLIAHHTANVPEWSDTLNVLDVQRYDEAVRLFEKTVKRITDAVLLPRPLV